ncbi:MAG: hypothetical protein ABI921_06970 [Panacibacter sp.]
MEIKFDKKGNLYNDLILSFIEFKELFGYSEERKKKIGALVELAKLLNSFNCKMMYVVGSFITAKKQPNDLDVCFDITELDEKALKKKHPELYTEKGLQEIHELLKVHVIYFTSYDTEILDWFRFDRNGNKRGIIKIFLKDLPGYDKE